jgi:peroxiredoxin
MSAAAVACVLAAGAGAQAPRLAPDFALSALNGGAEVRLSALRGTPVVLLFWASH